MFHAPLRKTLFCLLTAFCGLAALAGCSRNQATGKMQLDLISDQQEIAMGEEAAPQFEKEFDGAVGNRTLQAYVSQVGNQVAEAAERDMPYEFTLVRSDVPNAFALPGGKIFLTAGLMARMQNERQLAAVLAHEVAHVSAEHNTQGLQRQMGAQILVELAGAAAGADKQKAAEAAAAITANMVNLKYNRDAEHQADVLGVRYMHRAGYNPWGMVGLLKVLSALSGGAEKESSLANIFQTHPLTSERIEQAEQTIRDNHPQFQMSDPDPNAARFRDMRALLLREMDWN
ncbi:MAG: M48 family metalloprotease [Planctomycetota bacterium]